MRLPARLMAAAALAGTAAVLAGCASGPKGPRLPKDAIDVSASHCGQNWTDPHAGQQTLKLHNSGDTAAEAYLVNVTTGALYGEVEYLAPATTDTMTVTIGGGTYALRCVTDNDNGPVLGPRVRVAGAPARGTGVLPVTAADLYGPVAAYQQYVEQGLPVLVAKVDVLRSDLHEGDLAAARRDWLPAHLAYERLGAAYGSFGDFDSAVNGLPKAVEDEPPAGFHAIERGLWHGGSAATLAKEADRLGDDVRGLRKDFPSEQIDPGDLPLRAHEILENTLQFQLTGEADQGSGTELATAQANLQGTEEVLTVLRPVLAPRFAGLSTVDRQIAALGRLLAAQDHDGTWTPLDRLPAADRARINGVLGQLLEQLSVVPDIAVARRTTA